MSVNYLAVDLETTGLDADKDQILEVAWAPLDVKFNQLEPTRTLTLEMTPTARERLVANEYVKGMHQMSGLIADSLASTMTLALAESVIKSDADGWTWDATKLTIFGSSVHFDLRFIQKHMPSLADWLHYRVLDVTTVRSFVEAAGVPLEENRVIEHRAAADINWSINAVQRALRALKYDVRPGGSVITA